MIDLGKNTAFACLDESFLLPENPFGRFHWLNARTRYNRRTGVRLLKCRCTLASYKKRAKNCQLCSNLYQTKPNVFSSKALTLVTDCTTNGGTFTYDGTRFGYGADKCIKPRGGGVNPSAEEELVAQPGCTDAVSTFEFAGMFRVLIYLGMGQIFFQCS